MRRDDQAIEALHTDVWRRELAAELEYMKLFDHFVYLLLPDRYLLLPDRYQLLAAVYLSLPPTGLFTS